jgi:hypothetical protein
VRLLALHVRARRGGPIAGAVGAVAAVCWALAAFVADAGMVVAVVGPLALVSLVALALGGDDPGLERSTPRPWPRWRAAELGAAAIVVAGALLPALVAIGEDATAALRNLVGLLGITALGAVVAGARLAWCAPVGWACAGAALGARDQDWLLPLTWPVQAGEAPVAGALAIGLVLVGAGLHIALGARADDADR